MKLKMASKEKLEENSGLKRITKKFIKELCKKNKLYDTPYLNDVLYLHYQGFQSIENLEEYTGLKCLWLECNALSEITGLENQTKLKCLFLHNNLIKKIDNLQYCKELDTLNLSYNHINCIENLGCDKLPVLTTLNLSHNYLKTYDDLKELINCKMVSVLDLMDNRIEDILVVKVFADMPELKVLILQGNPIVNQIPQYRKTLILECKKLTYLDSRPVFERDRACAEAWRRGGYEEERKENARWNKEDRRKMRESINATLRLRNRGGGEPQADLIMSTDEEPDAVEFSSASSKKQIKASKKIQIVEASNENSDSDESTDGSDSNNQFKPLAPNSTPRANFYHTEKTDIVFSMQNTLGGSDNSECTNSSEIKMIQEVKSENECYSKAYQKYSEYVEEVTETLNQKDEKTGKKIITTSVDRIIEMVNDDPSRNTEKLQSEIAYKPGCSNDTSSNFVQAKLDEIEKLVLNLKNVKIDNVECCINIPDMNMESEKINNCLNQIQDRQNNKSDKLKEENSSETYTNYDQHEKEMSSHNNVFSNSESVKITVSQSDKESEIQDILNTYNSESFYDPDSSTFDEIKTVENVNKSEDAAENNSKELCESSDDEFSVEIDLNKFKPGKSEEESIKDEIDHSEENENLNLIVKRRLTAEHSEMSVHLEGKSANDSDTNSKIENYEFSEIQDSICINENSSSIIVNRRHISEHSKISDHLEEKSVNDSDNESSVSEKRNNSSEPTTYEDTVCITENYEYSEIEDTVCITENSNTITEYRLHTEEHSEISVENSSTSLTRNRVVREEFDTFQNTESNKIENILNAISQDHDGYDDTLNIINNELATIKNDCKSVYNRLENVDITCSTNNEASEIDKINDNEEDFCDAIETYDDDLKISVFGFEKNESKDSDEDSFKSFDHDLDEEIFKLVYDTLSEEARKKIEDNCIHDFKDFSKILDSKNIMKLRNAHDYLDSETKIYMDDEKKTLFLNLIAEIEESIN